MSKSVLILAGGVLTFSLVVGSMPVKARAVEGVSLQNRVMARCGTIENNISTKTSRFQNNKTVHDRQYTAFVTNLSNLITRLSAKGYDTAKLSADLVALNAKIATFKTDYAAYIATLNNTKQYTCGKSEGEFRNELAAARIQLRAVKADADAIRNMYQTVIRPDIQALKAQTVSTPAPSAIPSATPQATATVETDTN